jgi:hypothetical protein
VAGITLAENQTLPSMVNGIERAEMAQIIQYVNEMSYPTAGGTANALTLTPTTALAALASNVAYTFNAASANSTAATLAVSGLTAKAIRKIVGGTDVALAANDIQANGRYTVVYDTAANGAAGAWILTGTPPEVGVAIDGLTAKATPVDADEFILADSAASFLGKKVTGANLKKYGLNGLVVRVQAFAASGTYTPNANMVYCIVQLVGGGGAGGGPAAAAGSLKTGGGGGSGAFAYSIISKATIGASQTVTIGAGGSGVSGGNGNNGGSTSLGALVTAGGGIGGAANGSGGPGGAAGTATFPTTGNGGVAGIFLTSAITGTQINGGNGGSGPFGGAGAGGGAINTNAANGLAGTFGSGGGAGVSFNSASSATGGAGGDGAVLITEFCSA